MSDQTKRQIGIVYRWWPERAWGFIRHAMVAFNGQLVHINDKSFPDVFLHLAEAKRCGIDAVALDDVFEFETAIDRRSNKPKAVNLKRFANEQPAH